MTTAQSSPRREASAHDTLIAALRREEGDVRISELIQALRARGQGTDAILTHVMKALGPKATARVKQVASARAQHAATGTWQRYRPSRGKRLRLWLRNMRDDAADLTQRLRALLRRG